MARHPHVARLLVALAVLALATAACGGDDDGEAVRGTGDGATASGSGAASGAASGSASAECSPVGTELEDQATETISLTTDEYAFSRNDFEATAGIVTFEVTNQGDEPHELAFLPGGGEVPYTDGAPDEDALAEAGAFELEAFPPGRRARPPTTSSRAPTRCSASSRPRTGSTCTTTRA